MAAHIFVLCKSSSVIIHAFVPIPLLEAAFIWFARWILHIFGINLHGPSECSQLHLINGRTREGDSDWEERLGTWWPRPLILIRQNKKATFRSRLLRTSNARILMCFAKALAKSYLLDTQIDMLASCGLCFPRLSILQNISELTNCLPLCESIWELSGGRHLEGKGRDMCS